MEQASAIVGIVLYLGVFIGLMYLMVFLPQKRRDKKAKAMLDAMKVGSNVVTAGGIAGKVINIKDDEVVIETSVEKTQIRMKKWGIKEVEKLIEA